MLATITDVDVLRSLVAEKVAEIAHRDHTIRFKEAMIAKLTAEIARLRRVQFAAKSERMDPGQRELFDEAMAADLAAVESELAALRAPVPSPVAPRKTPQRRALPADLPRIETIHAPASCDCATCGGALVKIGEHVSEPLLRILRPRHSHIRVHRSSIANRSCSSCAVTSTRNMPASLARRSWPNRWHRRSSIAAWRPRAC